MRAAAVPPCAGGERVRMAESRVALVCPGQGAQKPGGVALLPARARAVFDRASALIGLDLWEAGLRGTPERLALPSILQPFLVAWAVAEEEQARAHRADLPTVDYVMGHSSGQNSAMVLGGAVGFADGVRFAHERGQRLDEGCRAEATGLVAVAGLERSEIDAIAAESEVAQANHNAQDQFVLGGRLANVERARALAIARGAEATLLRVAGAFHSEHFRAADAATEPLIAALPIADRFTPIIANADGRILTDAAALRSELSWQYTRPVAWVAALESAFAQGVRTFVLAGPGNAMNGLVRRFGRTAPAPLTTIRLNQPVGSRP